MLQLLLLGKSGHGFQSLAEGDAGTGIEHMGDLS